MPIDLFVELTAVADALDGDGIPYALCGALALAVHGAPRATRDLDLIARKQDAEKVRSVAHRVGFTFEALPMEFASGIEIQRFTKLVEGQPLMLDFLWAAGALAPIWDRRLCVSWRGRALFVVSRADLITLKLTAGRPQDLLDVQALAALEGRRDRI